MRDIPADGETMGEVLMRGNNVMLGYYDNPAATAECFDGGWFHSGDLAVVHPDGYIELRDRKKDIVISGGENISSIEVEKVLADHPAVAEVAIVAAPDEKWGEVPKAYIGLKPGASVTAEELVGVVPRAPGALQSAEARRIRPAAPHRDGQGPQERAARPGARDAGRTMNHIALTYEGPDRGRDPEPPAAPQRALARPDAGADRLPRRDRPQPRNPRRDSGRRRKGLLLRPRPLGDDRPRHQRIPPDLRRLHRADDEDPSHPAAGDRRGAGYRHRRRLPARRDLRHGGRRRGGGFATPGVKIGLFCTTPMVALTRAIGRKRALQMLLTGEMVDARTAADWGLINQAVPAAELAAATRKLAAKVAEASSLVVAIGKQAFYTQIDLDQPKAYAYAKEVMSMNALAADAQEGIGAFLGKRAAVLGGEVSGHRPFDLTATRSIHDRLPDPPDLRIRPSHSRSSG